jgi:hypothetical protein
MLWSGRNNPTWGNLGGVPLTALGSYDAFVGKLDGAGNHLWSKRFGDPLAEQTLIFGVATGASGAMQRSAEERFVPVSPRGAAGW